ncbi:MAG TPA: sulfatase, partial [Anaerolineales bacterium]|nr:sulfatase [Anaerolineales bacterium]
RASQKPNIIMLVFDAMSARHLSLYGYARRTTPNLEKFAERASVYHRHYAAGNFTTPGTASMLTGLYPWTHRAFNYRGMVERSLAERNVFHHIGDEYARLAFTQNLWADILLSQFEKDIDIHMDCDSYSEKVHSLVQPDDMQSDRSMAYYAFQDFLNFRVDDPQAFPGSLLVASVDLSRALAAENSPVEANYPRGLPTNYDYSYENDSVLSGIGQLVKRLKEQNAPYFAYFHVWSPHDPYNAREKYIGMFRDDINMSAKDRHRIAGTDYSEEYMRRSRREYDEFIADVDAEFGNLINTLEESGVLEDSYVIVTSDHGEMFERGEVGHASALLYAPVIHIPLLISAPGQETRADFHALTSNVDLLPTVMRIAGQEIPDWVEGRLLPGLGGMEDDSRSIFAVAAKDNPAFRPIEHGTFAMLKGPYELFFFTGYRDHPDAFELYNLEEDPDELNDLYNSDISIASEMKEELLAAVYAANRSFEMK